MNCQAVVGIDFGNAATGFAFAFTALPEAIHDGDLAKNPRYHKTPTALLATSDGEFISFGLEAIECYFQDCPRENNYFTDYKMALLYADSEPKVFSISVFPLFDWLIRTKYRSRQRMGANGDCEKLFVIL